MQNGTKVTVYHEGQIVSEIGIEQQDTLGLSAADAHAMNMKTLAMANGYKAWTEQIEDAENPGQMLDNPVSFWDAAVFAIGIWARKVVVGSLKAAKQTEHRAELDAIDNAANKAAVTVNYMEGT